MATINRSLKTVSGDVIHPETVSSQVTDFNTSVNALIDSKLAVYDASSQIQAAINDLINGAPSTFDTFKEIYDYIDNHSSEFSGVITQLNSNSGRITTLEGRLAIPAISNETGKFLKVGSSGLEWATISQPDLTPYALKSELPNEDLTFSDEFVLNGDTLKSISVSGRSWNLVGLSESEVDAKIAAVIAGAPAAYDTFKEVADYIAQNGSDVASLTSRMSAAETAINARVERELNGTNGKALIFNEADGGGAKFENNDGTWSGIAVNDGGANGIAGQLYVINKNNTSEGVKLNLEKGKITYIKNKATSARTANDELAVKGDIPTTMAWSAITDKPTVPTKVSDLTNDSGFITGAYVAANPTLLGGETELEALTVNGVRYALPASGNPSDNKTLKINSQGQLETVIGGWKEVGQGTNYTVNCPYDGEEYYYSYEYDEEESTYIIPDVYTYLVAFNPNDPVPGAKIQVSEDGSSWIDIATNMYLSSQTDGYMTVQDYDESENYADINDSFSDIRLYDWSSGEYEQYPYARFIISVPGATTYHPVDANFIPVDNSTIQVNSQGKLKGFSGNYNDLSNKPELFSGSYNDLSNKPTLFSGSYNDLSNKPTIPTDTQDLTNSAGFITSSDLESALENFEGGSGSEVDLSDYVTQTALATALGNIETILQNLVNLSEEGYVLVVSDNKEISGYEIGDSLDLSISLNHRQRESSGYSSGEPVWEEWEIIDTIPVDIQDCTVTGFDNTTAGEQTVTVEYEYDSETYEAEITVTVNAAAAAASNSGTWTTTSTTVNNDGRTVTLLENGDTNAKATRIAVADFNNAQGGETLKFNSGSSHSWGLIAETAGTYDLYIYAGSSNANSSSFNTTGSTTSVNGVYVTNPSGTYAELGCNTSNTPSGEMLLAQGVTLIQGENTITFTQGSSYRVTFGGDLTAYQVLSN